MIKRIFCSIIIALILSTQIASAEGPYYCKILDLYTLTPCHETIESSNQDTIPVQRLKINTFVKNVYISETKAGNSYNIVIEVGSQLISIHSAKRIETYKNPGNGWNF